MTSTLIAMLSVILVFTWRGHSITLTRKIKENLAALEHLRGSPD